MAPDSSLNHSMDSATKNYFSMFFLPSYRTTLLAVAAICIIAVNLCVFLIFPSFVNLYLGISFFVISFVTSTIVSKSLLKKNQIFSMRRTLVVSAVCWGIWLIFIILGVALSFWVRWLI